MNFNTIPGYSDAAGFGYYPGHDLYDNGSTSSYILGGDVFFNSMVYSPSDDILEVALHEIGHAMGLKHPFDGDPTLQTSLDNTQYTVMSYTDVPGYGEALGPLDQDALHYLYGTSSNLGSHLSGWLLQCGNRDADLSGHGRGRHDHRDGHP